MRTELEAAAEETGMQAIARRAVQMRNRDLVNRQRLPVALREAVSTGLPEINHEAPARVVDRHPQQVEPIAALAPEVRKRPFKTALMQSRDCHAIKRQHHHIEMNSHGAQPTLAQ